MSILGSILGACSTLQKADKTTKFDEEFASEVQLNAFEFRNFRTTLEANQQQTLERIINQWCAMLVKGRKLRVDGLDDKVFLDKDLLSLEYQREFYPLRTITKAEMVKDVDDMMVGTSSPYGLELTFTGPNGDLSMHFNFEQERHRLHFLLTLRILRTRDPMLDPGDPACAMEVVMDDEDDEEPQTYSSIVKAEHYNIDQFTSVVFSVSDLKLFHKVQSTSRHSYMEFFVKYPRQDRFLYAKSPTTHIPQNVLQTEDASLRRKKEKRDEVEEEEEKQKEELKKQVLGDEIPIAAMRFELKNVKLKIPKVPHKIFGRLMAKDDYFPTAIGTFEFSVIKAHLANRMRDDGERKKVCNKYEKELPATLRVPFYSTRKVQAEPGEEPQHQKIGTLTIRLMGYVTETRVQKDAPAPEEGAGGSRRMSQRNSTRMSGRASVLEKDPTKEVAPDEEMTDSDATSSASGAGGGSGDDKESGSDSG